MVTVTVFSDAIDKVAVMVEDSGTSFSAIVAGETDNVTNDGSSSSLIVTVCCCVPASVPFVTDVISIITVSFSSSVGS